MKHLLIAVTLLASASVGSAAIAIQSGPGNEGLGAFTGSMAYSFTNATTAQLVVSLTNTSPAANGGQLVAFAFNNPGNLITSVSLSSSLASFSTLLGSPSFNNSISAPNFAPFDIGASIKDSWLNPAPPNGGLTVGNSATWTFSFTGTALDTLTTETFVSTLNGSGEFFAARFMGFVDDGSDKVPGEVVPEPSTYAALFGALAGVVALHRRRKTNS